MKFAIDIGHNLPVDGGAVGIQSENKLVMDVGANVIYRLRKAGHQVVECKPGWASSTSDSLRRRCTTANQARADVFVSIHFNAFNRKAHGTEVFAISTTGRSIAKRVVDKIAALGFTNRGVKDGSRLYVVKNTSMPAILVECCFCDSSRDMTLFNADKMAAAIVSGLV
ncbi:MAG: N-acetylmuramoyl-L-alanine amidase [Richelia sp. RM2_1_2]|nr:N-acetylmuramoyl-L-alanine amidase [Richelia sp. SM1_7_0]NJN13597.1 N-acetylmuramoyl-L-alanine amidase [Richelia sp. RM1_1_1]NJO61341.1 N-acetylmuramoyl-L-alanine amidase [Richelia sp. RM2_1_2]